VNRSRQQVDETGTVDLETRQEQEELIRLARREFQSFQGVSDEVLKVHGVSPGSKPEGVTRLIYKNVNGIQCKWTNNDKVEKAREVHDE
jgi:DNA/RNA endonuclease YhcR with UshA esterase domain